jgi:hypothetical protein
MARGLVLNVNSNSCYCSQVFAQVKYYTFPMAVTQTMYVSRLIDRSVLFEGPHQVIILILRPDEEFLLEVTIFGTQSKSINIHHKFAWVRYHHLPAVSRCLGLASPTARNSPVPPSSPYCYHQSSYQTPTPT